MGWVGHVPNLQEFLRLLNLAVNKFTRSENESKASPNVSTTDSDSGLNHLSRQSEKMLTAREDHFDHFQKPDRRVCLMDKCNVGFAALMVLFHKAPRIRNLFSVDE